MKYEVIQGGIDPHEWHVEAIDFEADGECYVTTFSGPDAERRAREYAEWKSSASLVAA